MNQGRVLFEVHIAYDNRLITFTPYLKCQELEIIIGVSFQFSYIDLMFLKE